MHETPTTSHQFDGSTRNQTAHESTAQAQSRLDSAVLPPELLTEKQAAALLGIGPRKFHQLRAEPWLPRPIELGPRALRWNRSELLQAVATRAPRATIKAEPHQFQAARARRKGVHHA